MFCPRWFQISCAVFGLLLFTACLIIGILIPGIVNKAIDDSVKKGVTLEKGQMSDASWENFTQSKVDAYYYVYDITNAADVLATGAKPNAVALSAVKLWKHEYKRNIVASEGRTTFNRCYFYEVQDQQSADIMNQTVTVLNPVYLGATASAGRLFGYKAKMTKLMTDAQCASIASCQTNPTFIAGFLKTIAPNLASTTEMGQLFNDALFNLPVQAGGGIWPTLNGMFTASDSQLTAIAKWLAFPVWFSSVATQIVMTNAASGYTQQQLVLHICSGGSFLPKGTWASGQNDGTGTTASPPNPNWAGIEFSKPLFSFNAAASTPTAPGGPAFAQACAALFNTANPYSPLAMTGISPPDGYWFQLISQTKNSDPKAQATGAAIITGIAQFTNNAVVLDATDLPVIANWIATIVGPAAADAGATPTLNPAADVYTRVVFGTIQNRLQSYSWFQKLSATTQAGYYPTQWSDLMTLQWGTGMLASMFVDLSNGNTAVGDAGKATSVTALMGTSLLTKAGLDPRIIIELAPACSGKYPIPVLLPLSLSKLLLSTLAKDYSTVGAIYLSLLQLAASYTPGTAPTATQISAAVDAVGALLGLGATQAERDSLGSLKTLLGALGTTSPYFVPCALTSFGNINSYTSATLPALNSGLFIKLTVGEVLFGQNARQLGGKAPGAPGVITTWDYVTGKYYTRRPNIEDTINNFCLPYEQSRPFVYETGSRDISTLGAYVKYEGVSTYQTYCQYWDPATASVANQPNVCYGDDTSLNATIPNVFVNNYNMYGQPITIAGTYDGTIFPPLQENNIVPQYSIFVSNVYRPVLFDYSKEVTIKDIKMRRYVMSPKMLYGATADTTNAWRNAPAHYMDATYPGGLVALAGGKGGVPVAVSQPMLLGVDAATKATITGQDENPANEANYLSYVDIEPLTGKTMNAAKRLQANFYIDPDHFSWFSYNSAFINSLRVAKATTGAPGAPVPYYWAQEGATISDDDAASFRKSVQGNRDMAHQLSIALIVVGAFFVVVFVAVVIWIVFCNKPTNN